MKKTDLTDNTSLDQTKRQIADAIAARLAVLGWSHGQAAAAIGSNRTTLCTICNGHVDGHSLPKIIRMAEALGVRMSIGVQVTLETSIDCQPMAVAA